MPVIGILVRLSVPVRIYSIYTIPAAVLAVHVMIMLLGPITTYAPMTVPVPVRGMVLPRVPPAVIAGTV